ncbi:calcium binding protein [Alloactinosynnema sp. L-07]|uniref:EF-hand domain-containing protein n=1 Tax=Alloactinosynnema sp. L-07 TaxID=1653480 RepID=UPI00065F09A4|nr:calcium-binding protein [Alloactinosynnema sp. L-07]CRK56045.1 calcium binding protein [Alloactinosynnema sp. L-07]
MEISPFLERKLARRFQTFDIDGDGDIDRADFETSAIRLAREFGHGPDSPARRRLLELSLDLWGRLADAADADEDSAISVDEYKAAFAADLLVTEESFEAGYRPFLDAVMAVVDTNDGKLNVEEHIRWTGALMDLPEEDARTVHRRLDTDTDGLIGTEDLLRAIHGFYFDEDPEGSGGWLLGALP